MKVVRILNVKAVSRQKMFIFPGNLHTYSDRHILTYVDVEDVELHLEHVVDLADGPDEQDAGEDAADEVVRPVPALDARAVHAQDRLPDRQRAVVPDQQEHKYQVQDPAVRQENVSSHAPGRCQGSN